MSLSCACDAVKGSAIPDPSSVGVCHCSTCRKWSGGAFIAVTCSEVSFEDLSKLNTWVSSDWGERVSCATCGSALVWQTRDGTHYSVSAQAFDDPSQFSLSAEIFIDDKPAFYAFAGDHEKLTRAEVMAKYAAGQEAH